MIDALGIVLFILLVVVAPSSVINWRLNEQLIKDFKRLYGASKDYR